MLCSNFLSDVWTETGVLGQTACGSSSWVWWASYKFWMTWEHCASSTFLHCVCVNVLVVITLSKWRCLQVQFDLGLTGARRFPTVLDYRDLCLYHEPRMRCVVMNCCSFHLFLFSFSFFHLCVGCPSPQRRIRDMELLSVVSPVPK